MKKALILLPLILVGCGGLFEEDTGTIRLAGQTPVIYGDIVNDKVVFSPLSASFVNEDFYPWTLAGAEVTVTAPSGFPSPPVFYIDVYDAVSTGKPVQLRDPLPGFSAYYSGLNQETKEPWVAKYKWKLTNGDSDLTLGGTTSFYIQGEGGGEGGLPVVDAGSFLSPTPIPGTKVAGRVTIRFLGDEDLSEPLLYVAGVPYRLSAGTGSNPYDFVFDSSVFPDGALSVQARDGRESLATTSMLAANGPGIVFTAPTPAGRYCGDAVTLGFMVRSPRGLSGNPEVFLLLGDNADDVVGALDQSLLLGQAELSGDKYLFRVPGVVAAPGNYLLVVRAVDKAGAAFYSSFPLTLGQGIFGFCFDLNLDGLTNLLSDIPLPF